MNNIVHGKAREEKCNHTWCARITGREGREGGEGLVREMGSRRQKEVGKAMLGDDVERRNTTMSSQISAVQSHRLITDLFRYIVPRIRECRNIHE